MTKNIHEHVECLQGKHVLVVTPGLPDKKSFLLDGFQATCQTDAVFGMKQAPEKFDRILRLIGKGSSKRNTVSLNKEIVRAVQENAYDLICVIKGLAVEKSTLEAVRRISPDTKIILWTCDDLALPHNQSKCFLESASQYDVVFTTKSNNLRYGELSRIGFRRVEFLYQAFSTADHRPITDPAWTDRHGVLFIGYGEEQRFTFMNYLARNGVPVDVYGNGWKRPSFAIRAHANLKLHKQPLFHREYAAAITNAAINLCFLRVKNRDIHTSRSIEIPACGGFMLAERTDEHSLLFREGEEAEFFCSKEELLHKVRKYLKQPVRRMEISRAGCDRTRKDNYSYEEMVMQILRNIFQIGPTVLRRPPLPSDIS
ncbi:glycosyltransferase [bacterium AH-315-P15]|nr:glycosyltransferase [bacterium AH-315-P15]